MGTVKTSDTSSFFEMKPIVLPIFDLHRMPPKYEKRNTEFPGVDVIYVGLRLNFCTQEEDSTPHEDHATSVAACAVHDGKLVICGFDYIHTLEMELLGRFVRNFLLQLRLYGPYCRDRTIFKLVYSSENQFERTLIEQCLFRPGEIELCKGLVMRDREKAVARSILTCVLRDNKAQLACKPPQPYFPYVGMTREASVGELRSEFMRQLKVSYRLDRCMILPLWMIVYWLHDRLGIL